MQRLPQWATPERRTHLVALFQRSNGFCVFQQALCPTDAHHYEVFIEGLIRDWVKDDAQRRACEWKLEQRRMATGEVGRWGAPFDPVAREQYIQRRMEYQLVGLGVNAFTHRSVALVRVPSLSIHLFVDIAWAVQPLSRNGRRKLFRYGSAPRADVMRRIEAQCREAVRDWWRRQARGDAPPASFG